MRKMKWHPHENWQDDDFVMQNLVKKLMSDLKALKKRNMKTLLKIKLERNNLYTDTDINKIMKLIKRELQKRLYPIASEEKFYKLNTSVSIKIYLEVL